MTGGAPDARDESRVLPIVVHGDASFPGEGVVAETLNMSLLRGYRVGGTLHIIANNQVGFTTDPNDARSTHYASDLAKGFEIPIVHVNADDAEACIQAVRLGLAYRQRFNKDFLIDLVGYRRHGHNEADQPAFTQPLMYKIISEHPTPREVFGARLVRERLVTTEDVKSAEASASASRLQQIYQEMKQRRPGRHERRGPRRTDASRVDARDGGARREARRAQRAAARLAVHVQAAPDDAAHGPAPPRRDQRRRDRLGARRGAGLRVAASPKARAFASPGQDAERGTFSHRQAVLHDVNTGEMFTPLRAAAAGDGDIRDL